MPFYQWSEEMSVGVERLDSDHRALIDLINRLHRSLEDDEEHAILDETFDRLLTYIDYHFAREEGVMEVCGFPTVASHRDQHRGFTQEIRYVRDRYVKGGDGKIGEDLLQFLKNWLTHHILVQDMAYRPYVEGNPQAEEAAQRFGPGLTETEATTPLRSDPL